MSDRAVKSILDGAEIITIAPNTIDVSGRIGDFFPDKATALGRLMAVDGQKTPINVSRLPAGGAFAWKLHVGMHRVAGAKIEGLQVHAIVVSGKPEELAKLEASENLERRTPEPLERAKFTAALVQATQERIARQHGDLKHWQLGAKARWAKVKSGESLAQQALTDEVSDACATIAQAYGWEESVGEALSMSRRTIHNDLQLYRLIVEPFPDLAQQLAHHPVVGTNAAQLRQIAQVKDEGHRRRVIEQLLADPEIGTDDARILAGVAPPAGPAPARQEKFYAQIESGWSRLGLPQRREFIPKLASMLGTDGLKREMRDRLNAELGETVASAEKPVPAVAIRASVKPDYLVCLDCGEKMERLPPHLHQQHGLSIVRYLARWDLPLDYPMTAPYLSEDDEEPARG